MFFDIAPVNAPDAYGLDPRWQGGRSIVSGDAQRPLHRRKSSSTRRPEERGGGGGESLFCLGEEYVFFAGGQEVDWRGAILVEKVSPVVRENKQRRTHQWGRGLGSVERGQSERQRI